MLWGLGPHPGSPSWGPVIRLPTGKSTVAPTHSLGPVAMGIGPQPGSHWGEGAGGRSGRAGEPSCSRQGRGLRLRKPSGRGGWRRRPSPLPASCSLWPPAVLWPAPSPVLWPAPSPPCSLARHTRTHGGLLAHATLSTGRPPVMGARHGHRRRGGGRVLAWQAGPGRAPCPRVRPGRALRCPREELPGGKGSAARPPTGRLWLCPDK